MFSFLKKKKEKNTICAIVDGTAIPVESVDDEVFSTKTMGDGMAFVAADTKIVAPCKATVNFIAPTKHAIGLLLDNQMQILIHIGLDAEAHNENSFIVSVSDQDRVSPGQTLVEINEEHLKAFDELVIPMILLENPKQVSYQFENLNQSVKAGQDVIMNIE